MVAYVCVCFFLCHPLIWSRWTCALWPFNSKVNSFPKSVMFISNKGRRISMKCSHFNWDDESKIKRIELNWFEFDGTNHTKMGGPWPFLVSLTTARWHAGAAIKSQLVAKTTARWTWNRKWPLEEVSTTVKTSSSDHKNRAVSSQIRTSAHQDGYPFRYGRVPDAGKFTSAFTSISCRRSFALDFVCLFSFWNAVVGDGCIRRPTDCECRRRWIVPVPSDRNLFGIRRKCTGCWRNPDGAIHDGGETGNAGSESSRDSRLCSGWTFIRKYYPDFRWLAASGTVNWKYSR